MTDSSTPAAATDVVLLEFGDEVDRFLAHCAASGRAPESYLVLALWPEVQVALKRRGVAHADTLAFFNNDSHRRIVLTSERWLEAVERRAPLVDSDDLSETYSRELSFQLRFYITYFLWVVEILDGVCQARRVTGVTACAASVPEGERGNPTMRPSDRYLGSIVREYAAAHGLSYTALPGAPAPGRRPAVERFALLLDRLLASPLGWLDWHRSKRLGSKPTIVVTSLAYNMSPLVARVRRRFPEAAVVLLETGAAATKLRIRRLRRGPDVEAVMSAVGVAEPFDSRLEDGLARFERLLAADWVAEFVSSGVSFTAVFGAKIRAGLMPWIREVRSASAALRAILRTLRPRLVISPFAIGPVAAIGEICRQMGIPGLVVPHGMLTPPGTEADAIETFRLGTGFVLTTFEHTALQSPWSERYVEAFPDRVRPSVIRTGNLLLSTRQPDLRAAARRRLFGLDGDEVKVAVYATTLKPRSSLRLQIHETLDEHLAGIADLAAVARETPGLRLLVKLHPGGALSERQVRELVAGVDHERIAVSSTIPFREALSAADLLVSYSSTCVEEAIQAGMPVLLYDRWARYQHLPGVCLNDLPPAGPMPVYYVSDASRLTDAIRWIIEKHDQSRIPAAELARHVYPPGVSAGFEAFVERHLAVRPAHAS